MGISGAMVVVGNVVDEPSLSRVVGVLMTVGGGVVEEVVLGTDVVVVVESGGDDGSLLFVVVVVRVVVIVVEVGLTVEGGKVSPVSPGVVGVLPKLVVVGLVVVVITDELDESKVVVVSDGASVVDDARVLVGQCW